jgi:hypothetical protein
MWNSAKSQASDFNDSRERSEPVAHLHPRSQATDGVPETTTVRRFAK